MNYNNIDNIGEKFSLLCFTLIQYYRVKIHIDNSMMPVEKVRDL
jgi:hypothetical protein